MRSVHIAALALLAGSVFAAAPAAGQNSATPLAAVETFNPQGQTKSVRQVSARFSEPMVNFGDPVAPAPFQIQCAVAGNGHWIDSRNWVYDFEHDLAGGLNCRFTPVAGLRSLAGHALSPQSYSFNTGGPAVLGSLPEQGSEAIDENQSFLLALDAAVDPKSVTQHAYCQLDGVGERIAVRLIEGSQREQLIKQQSEQASQFFLLINKRARASLLAVKNPAMRDNQLLALRCERSLPAGARLQLHWKAGIRTPDGIASSTDQSLEFGVRNSFSARTACTRINPNAGCVPVTPLTLLFSAPVERKLASQIRLRYSDGRQQAAQLADDESIGATVESVYFKAPLPANSDVRIELPGNFRDDAGRPLDNAASFPLTVHIDDDPPLVKFSSRFGILESHADPALPVSVRNVENPLAGLQLQAGGQQKNAIPAGTANQVANGSLARLDSDDDALLAKWIYAVTSHPYQDQAAIERFNARYKRYPMDGEIPLLLGDTSALANFQTSPLQLSRKQSDKALELIGIPLKKPGFYIVELASQRLGAALHGAAKPYYVSSSALVTNLAVHLKKGRESSLVWVTRLDNAQPVAAARIRISSCDGRQLWQGNSDASGIARVSEALPETRSRHCSGWLVSARKDDDMSFMLSSWDNGISPWNFNLGSGSVNPVIAHTVFDRPLFRAGETVSMKHFVRLHTGNGLTSVRQLGNKISIEHQGSGQIFDVPVQWSANSGSSSWQIPKEARLGSYTVSIHLPEGRLTAGSFRVEQYRVPLMRAVMKPPAQPVVNRRQLDIDVQLNLMAGGAAAGAPVKIRSRMQPYPLQFAGYEDFQFGGEQVQVGIQALQPYAYDPGSDDESPADPATSDSSMSGTDYPPATRQLTLDGNGGARIRFDKLPKVKQASALEVEMEYADPNGQLQTAATRAILLPSAVTLGIRLDSYFARREQAAFKVLALTADGKPLADQAVSVDAYSRKTYAYRKRMLGGFYAYEQTQEIKRLGTLCSGRTDVRGLLSCTNPAPDSGELLLVASSKDLAGNPAIASHEMYIADGESWLPNNQSDRIDLLADQRSYQPGDKARFEVRMPFRTATALVTVEREGVLASWITQISAEKPYVEVPIAASYGPNAYVSVMVIRGRVDPEVPGPFSWLKRMIYQIGHWFGLVRQLPQEIDTRPTALVDLSKPAFRLGIVPIKVGWNQYQLNVQVKADKSVYRPREQAQISISVTDSQGKPAANAEVALAAVDEGLLQLAKPESWNLLEAMMGKRPLEVHTATAQSQVVGKRHFGKKAAAPGGGGGAQAANARELFDTLLAWQATLKLDANGKAQVSVPLNDSLTGFRIAAIAHAGASQFGTGTAEISSSQELMLFSGLPPLVREGDQFAAMLTVRNGSQRSLNLDVAASMDSGNGARQLGQQRITLAAGEAQTLSFPAAVPFDSRQLRWLLSAKEAGAAAGPRAAQDSLRLSQQVISATPVRVYQQTLQQLQAGQPWSMPVQKPASAIAGRGGIEVRLSNSLVGDMASLREWALAYPFSCIEQRASVAVVLEDRQRWDKVMQSLNMHLDRDGLVRYFPIDWLPGDDSLTAYLLSIADETGMDLPEAARDKMLTALEGFVKGRITRYGALQTVDLTLRKLAAIDALARYQRARPEWLESLEITPNLWPSSALIDYASLLGRINGIPGREQKLRDTLQILRSRMTFSGSMLNFSTEKQDYLWWLMISPDLNSVRALRLLSDDPQSNSADIGRLARATMARQRNGHWQTTITNAWGVVALRHFQQKFERDPVAGSSLVKLASQQQELAWASARPASNPLTGAALTTRQLTTSFGWPAGAGNLQVLHQGSGSPWAQLTARAALPVQQPLFAGYQLKRSVTPLEQKTPGHWQRGDSYRVKLEIEAQTDMTWVAINDPVPTGATILGSGLGGQSAQLASGQQQRGWSRPAFEEKAMDAYRAYYAFVPKGKFSLEYSVLLNNPGRFEMPASRVEAMYAPEMFAEIPVARIEVMAK